jgi:hypothetical protein
MAIFFPARKESSPSRTRGAPKVDSGDVQNFAPPQNRGTRSVPGAFGEEGAKALKDAGDSIQNVAFKKIEQQRDAQALAEDRNDKILEVYASRAFNEAVNSGLDKMRQEGGDISLQETQEKERAFIQEEANKQVDKYPGSEKGRQFARVRLDTQASVFINDSGVRGRKRQAEVLGEQVDRDLNDLVLRVSGDPSQLQEVLDDADRVVRDNINVLTVEQTDAFTKDAHKKIYSSALSTLIFKGELGAAEDLLYAIKARRSLGVNSVEEFRNQIKKVKDAGGDGFKALIESVQNVVGPLSRAETLSLMKVTADKATKVEEVHRTIKFMKDNDIPVSEEQAKRWLFEAAGSLSAEEVGIQKSEEKKAEILRDMKNGFYPPDTFRDERNNLKVEVSERITNLATQALGGWQDAATGKTTGLPPELAKAVPGIAAKVGALLINRTFTDMNAALAAVLASSQNIPQPLSRYQSAVEMIKNIRESTDIEIAESAAAYDKIDVNNATGAKSAIIGIFGNIFGQGADGFVDPQNAEDRNELKSLAHDLMLANAQSDGKVSVFEQKVIQSMFSGPSVFESGESVRAVLRALDRNVSEEISDRLAALKLTSLPGKEALEIYGQLQTLVRFQKKLSKFDLSPGGKNTIEFKSIEDIEKQPIEVIQGFLNKQTKQSLIALPEGFAKALWLRDMAEKNKAKMEAETEGRRQGKRLEGGDKKEITIVDGKRNRGVLVNGKTEFDNTGNGSSGGEAEDQSKKKRNPIMPDNVESLVRDPNKTEMDFFNSANGKNVPAMSTEDGRIIVNPNSKLSKDELQAVKVNEAVRVKIKDTILPEFELTEKQNKFFNTINGGKPYGSKDDINKTVIARIISGDPSAQDITQDQIDIAKQIGNEIGIPSITPDNGESKNGNAFDPEGLGYDYKAAKNAGMERDSTGHMGSVAPVSKEDREKFSLPDNSYIILKGKKHETFDKAVKAEEDRGSKVIKLGSRYYSVPKGFKPGNEENPFAQPGEGVVDVGGGGRIRGQVGKQALSDKQAASDKAVRDVAKTKVTLEKKKPIETATKNFTSSADKSGNSLAVRNLGDDPLDAIIYYIDTDEGLAKFGAQNYNASPGTVQRAKWDKNALDGIKSFKKGSLKGVGKTNLTAMLKVLNENKASYIEDLKKLDIGHNKFLELMVGVYAAETTFGTDKSKVSKTDVVGELQVTRGTFREVMAPSHIFGQKMAKAAGVDLDKLRKMTDKELRSALLNNNKLNYLAGAAVIITKLRNKSQKLKKASK